MPDSAVNILIVDDRPENLLALEATLGGLGQNLVTASSGREALKRLLDDDFAVILLDVQMTGMDGFETATLIRAREKTQHTPIVFLTAVGTTNMHVARGYAVGAVDYVFKPFDPEVLRAKVSAFVDLFRKTQELQAEIEQRKRAEERFRTLNNELERRVKERTAAQEAANRELQSEIAERKQLETALQQRAHELAEADRRKDEFLAMLAHELRNPLAPIGNAVQVLKTPGSSPSAQRRARDVVERQVAHMSRLVDELLDVSRITRGTIELRPQPVDLTAHAAHAVETVRPSIDQRGHDLQVSLPNEPLWVQADPLRLEQVITNLLNNATKFTDPEGQLWLSVEREPIGAECAVLGAQQPDPPRTAHSAPRTDYAVIRVRDTGRGIEASMLPHIFDLFVQADRSLDRAQGGLGIGLTLVQQLVELHGGTVQAASEGPGRGSEFIVRLPAMAGGDERSTEGEERLVEKRRGMSEEFRNLPPAALCPAPESPLPAAQRILVVDDNVDAAEMLADLIDLWGSEVRIAHDGPSAINEAVSFHPNVVLLDIGLPGMNGYEVAKRLRQQEGLEQALLIAITGYGQEEDRRRSREAEVDFHLTKPVDPDKLRRLFAETHGKVTSTE